MADPRGAPALPPPPSGTRRLFPHLEREELENPAVGPFVLGRLLEEGEGDDLRWLAATAGEDALRAWLAERGGRQLSRRSRAFWQLVLGPETNPTAGRDSGFGPEEGSEEGELLWPL